MMKILGRIPKEKFYVACSGGTDSMTLVDFLLQYPKNKFEILHFNHETPYCQEAEDFLKDFCESHSLKLHIGHPHRKRQPDESREEYWRNMRYSFFSKFTASPILMSHHLNDAVETWIMTSLHGQPRTIPYFNPKYNLYRPFLCVPKSEINDWIERHHVKHVIDKSNYDTDIPRNLIRHKMMDDILKISPGIMTTVKNKILEEYKRLSSKE